jgi:hypothetical protein
MRAVLYDQTQCVHFSETKKHAIAMLRRRYEVLDQHAKDMVGGQTARNKADL